MAAFQPASASLWPRYYNLMPQWNRQSLGTSMMKQESYLQSRLTQNCHHITCHICHLLKKIIYKNLRAIFLTYRNSSESKRYLKKMKSLFEINNVSKFQISLIQECYTVQGVRFNLGFFNKRLKSTIFVQIW